MSQIGPLLSHSGPSVFTPTTYVGELPEISQSVVQLMNAQLTGWLTAASAE
jgi:hypothetical protein